MWEINDGRILHHAKETMTNSSTRKNKVGLLFPIQRRISLSARFEIFSDRRVGNGGERMKYPVIIHKGENSDYGVTFPDLPGCFSAGDTIEESLANAQKLQNAILKVF